MQNIFSHLRSMQLTFRQILNVLGDLLFPQKAETAKLERMTAEEFLLGRACTKALPISDTYAILSYENDLVREAVWQLKYKKNEKVAELFTEVLAKAISQVVGAMTDASKTEKPIITSIPLSKRRLNERGYHQIDFIFKKLTGNFPEVATTIEIRTDILSKERHTSTQTKLDRAERMKNLEGCFKVLNPEAIKGKDLILIDDVVTTGSTVEEARRTLLNAGARSVSAISLTH